jgi:excisionase family DNA binding protein
MSVKKRRNLDPAENPTMTVEELAEILGTGRTATYDAVRQGGLPVIKVGRKLLIPTAAVRRLLELDPAPTPAP